MGASTLFYFYIIFNAHHIVLFKSTWHAYWQTKTVIGNIRNRFWCCQTEIMGGLHACVETSDFHSGSLGSVLFWFFVLDCFLGFDSSVYSSKCFRSQKCLLAQSWSLSPFPSWWVHPLSCDFQGSISNLDLYLIFGTFLFTFPFFFVLSLKASVNVTSTAHPKLDQPPWESSLAAWG